MDPPRAWTTSSRQGSQPLEIRIDPRWRTAVVARPSPDTLFTRGSGAARSAIPFDSIFRLNVARGRERRRFLVPVAIGATLGLVLSIPAQNGAKTPGDGGRAIRDAIIGGTAGLGVAFLIPRPRHWVEIALPHIGGHPE